MFCNQGIRNMGIQTEPWLCDHTLPTTDNPHPRKRFNYLGITQIRSIPYKNPLFCMIIWKLDQKGRKKWLFYSLKTNYLLFKKQSNHVANQSTLKFASNSMGNFRSRRKLIFFKLGPEVLKQKAILSSTNFLW